MNDPTPHHSDTTRHPVDVLAEEFAERMRRGEQPSIDEYVSRFPQYADVLRSVLEPIEAVERVSSIQAPSMQSNRCDRRNSWATFGLSESLGAAEWGSFTKRFSGP